MATNSDDGRVPETASAASKPKPASQTAAAQAALETLKAGFSFESSAPRQGAYDEDLYDDGGEEFWDDYIDPDELQAGKGVFNSCGFSSDIRQFPHAQISASSLAAQLLRRVPPHQVHQHPKLPISNPKSAIWTSLVKPSI